MANHGRNDVTKEFWYSWSDRMILKSNEILQVDRHARQTSMVLVRAGEGQQLESRQSTVEDIKVPAGEAVDIFYRYGAGQHLHPANI